MDLHSRGASFRERIRPTLALVVGTTFIVSWFALVPAKLIKLNQQWGWPSVNNLLLELGGLSLMLAAVIASVYCAVLFGHVGKGTPVPGNPPKHLVTGGPYQISRNPIYVAYVCLLFGEFLFFGYVILLLYAVVTFIGFHAAIVWIEEPILRRRFGKEYLEFMRNVPRWIHLKRGRWLRGRIKHSKGRSQHGPKL